MRQPGDVFYAASTKSFWMVVGEPYKGLVYNGMVYPVVKCNKNGKTFSVKNGFDVKFVDGLPSKDEVREGQSYFVGNFNPTKVSTDGKKAGQMKRRIQYLRDEIKKMQSELDMLQDELGLL